MEINYAFDPDSAFQKKLERVFRATGDLTIPLTLMAESWFKGNQSIFNLKSKGRYEDLSDKYKKSKEKAVGFVYPILMRTGRLADSITDSDAAESINMIVNKNTLVLGTRTPYAIYHQSQSDGPSGSGRTKMPYRPFLFVGVEQIAPNDIQNNRLKTWMKTLDNYFQQVMDSK